MKTPEKNEISSVAAIINNTKDAICKQLRGSIPTAVDDVTSCCPSGDGTISCFVVLDPSSYVMVVVLVMLPSALGTSSIEEEVGNTWSAFVMM